MTSSALMYVLAPLGILAAAFVAFAAFALRKYTPIVERIFQERPLFLPLRLSPVEGGEDVRFPTADGLELSGTYLTARTPTRAGVLVFCHEYLSDRWSFQPYAGHLRDCGFDVFTFDFRNHGASGSDPSYQPLQWVSDHEVRDLEAALAYLRTRQDADPAGVGLFGISRGGGAALVVAASEPRVWGVITDGAFPTRGTMLAYILKWAEIYVTSHLALSIVPTWMFALLGTTARLRSQRRLSCRFPDIETAVARLSPRAWLAIHGEKDAYIRPEIARRLHAHAREPKQLWIVPKAKHNRCREVEPTLYAERVVEFLRKYAPRSVANPTAEAVEEGPEISPRDHSEPVATPGAALAGGLAAPLPS